jgi:membrane-associated phospholipid phosphatase
MTLSSRSHTSTAMSPSARIGWLVVLFLAQLLYFPINRNVQGGVVLDTHWDSAIPLWPVWAVPYLLSLVWWMTSFIWATWKMEDTLYRAFAVGTLSVIFFSYLVYIFYPTYIERPVLEGNNWATDLVRFIYSQDRVYNAFPSGHTYTTVLISLFWSRWFPRKRWLWITIAVIVLLSTLFTGQHNLPDLLAGTLLAWGGYRFGLWWERRMMNDE